MDVLDVCLAPLALRTSQPAVEPIVVALGGTERDPGIDLSALLNLGDKLESVLTRYRGQLESTRSAVIDARVLSHQIPGGMASNMVSQLREADALDKLDEVLANMPSTPRRPRIPASRYPNEPDGRRSGGEQRIVRALRRHIRPRQRVRQGKLRQARLPDQRRNSRQGNRRRRRKVRSKPPERPGALFWIPRWMWRGPPSPT